MIDFSGNVKIDGRYGTWYEIDRAKASDGNEYILFESEQYGGDTAAVLCILPKDNQVKKMVGKTSGKEYVVIPHEFEVEETYDDIVDAIEQDLGLDIIDEDVEETEEVIEEALDVSEDERSTILNFFNRQKLLWSNYPDIVDERYTGDDYEVELDNSNPTYIADTEESLRDLCEKIAPDFAFDVVENDNGFYGRTYIFYHADEDLDETLNEGEEEGETIRCSRCGNDYIGQRLPYVPNLCPDCIAKQRAEWKAKRTEWVTNNTIQINDDISACYEGSIDVDDYYSARGDESKYGGVSFSITSKSNPEIDNNLFVNFVVSEDDVDLEYGTERWDDPGDYPSGAGGGPLASYDYEVIEDGTLNLKKDELMDCCQYEWDGRFVDDEVAAEKSGLSIDTLKEIAEKVIDKAYKGLEDDGVPALVEYLAEHYEG